MTDDPVLAYAKAVLAGDIVAGPHVRNACRRHMADLKAGPSRGLKWDLAAAKRALEFFPDVLRLAQKFDGLPFDLHASQKFIIGSLFGWKRGKHRRFRRAYIEQSKGNGKSPMAAGIGMYMLVADGEQGAEVYAGASQKSQAMVLFRDAVAMWRQSPSLAKRLTPSGGNPIWNLADLKSASFFRPISTDEAHSGPRPSCALLDEIHEHRDGHMIEMMERGFKSREQPLLVMITNSGSDRLSVCWQEHQHAIRCAAGTQDIDGEATYVGEVIDDTTFSFVCGLDSARTETFSYGRAMRHMRMFCSCHSVPITLIDRLTVEAYVANVTADGIASKAADGARNIQTGQSLSQAPALSATRGNRIDDRQSHSLKSESVNGDGKKRTRSDLENIRGSGYPISQDTDWQSLKNRLYEITASLGRGLPNSLQGKTENAQSACANRSGSVLTTVTKRGDIEACSASPATRELVFSEIMQRVWNEHSPTCEARKSKLCGSSLIVELPADDPLEDPTCWVKANPLLGITMPEEELARAVKQAKAIPGKLNNILRLHFCTWTSSDQAWMSRPTLEAVLHDFDPEMHSGESVFIGLDLSATQDLTAMACVVPTGEDSRGLPTFDAWVEAWTPAGTLAERALRDNAPYEVWARDGWLQTSPGKVINFAFVASRMAEVASLFEVKSLAYDSYGFGRMFEPELDEIGLTLPVVEHPQGGKKKGKTGLWMPGSKLALENAILEGRIRLRRSPVLVSACMAAATENDPYGNFWFSKRKATMRIDALVALAMAFGAASGETESEPEYQLLFA